MPKHKDPLVAALLAGNPYVVTITDGGDLASMRAALKHGQILTFSPIRAPQEVQIGDIVIVRWRGSNFMMHLVQEIQHQKCLIVNSLGKINGWVPVEEIIGRASQIIDPPKRPSVPQMLDKIQRRYSDLIEKLEPEVANAERLLSIAGDLRWYADAIGADRWTALARGNLWSYESTLWHLSKELEADLAANELKSTAYYINHGKEHIGQLAIALRLFEDL